MQVGGKKLEKTNPLGILAAAAGALVAVGLLVLMLLVVEARPAEATFPGQNGRIAYTAYDGWDDEIYTIRPTGGSPFEVTNNESWRYGEDTIPFEDRWPSYSPDGMKIAYVGYDENVPVEGDYEIFTINAAGGTPFQVTHDTAEGWEVRSPAFSPDGKRIAYTQVAPTSLQTTQIYTIDATGGTPFNVTKDSTGTHHDSPDYSPDGKTIAYTGYDGHDYEIYTIDATGGTPFNVTNNGTDDYDPSYSPNGRKIAYTGYDGNDTEIYKISPAGGTPLKVTNNRRGEYDPSYSPNGRKIAYLSDGGQGYDSEIYKIDHNGGTPVNVTNNETDERWPSWGSRP
jgi:Tol biopolymer transport system component